MCQNIPGYVSLLFYQESKVICRIIACEEGEPGDEPNFCTGTYLVYSIKVNVCTYEHLWMSLAFLMGYMCRFYQDNITQFGSTVYIGITMVLYSSHTFGNSVLTFNSLLMTLYRKSCETKLISLKTILCLSYI